MQKGPRSYRRHKLKHLLQRVRRGMGELCNGSENAALMPEKEGCTKRKIFKNDSIWRRAVMIIHRFIALVVRACLVLVHGENGPAMPPLKDPLLTESASSLAQKIRTGKVTSERLIKACIARIEEVNPMLNCVVDKRFEEALADAKRVDEMIASGITDPEILAKEKPFLGVPFTTKDCIMVKDLLHTAGLACRRNVRGATDAKAVALLRASGAIPLGLTNVSECCMWWESHNPVHGRTRNPYDTNRTVGGSSGGEGCLQAAAGIPFGIGSDIGGSIRIPSFFNGIFGHKPSRGIVSNEGQCPKPHTPLLDGFNGIGPMSRFSTDLLPMLKIMSDEKAAKLRLDEPVDLRNVKIYYQEDDLGYFLTSPVDKDIKKCMHDFLNHMKTAYDAKPKLMRIEKLRRSAAIWLSNMKCEGPTFEEQLMNCEGRINSALELLKWCIGKSNHTLIALMTAIVDNTTIKVGSPKHRHYAEQREIMEGEFNDLLGDDGVFIYPTHPTPAPYHNEPLIIPINFSYTGIINCLGLPATACPMGLGKQGLPIGFQVIGGLHQDRLCLAVAREIERAFGGWVPPPLEF